MHIDPMKPNSKPPGTKRLKLKCDLLLSISAFNFNLRRFSEEDALLRHAYRWETDVRAVGRHCKQRPYRAAATDVQGRSVVGRCRLTPDFPQIDPRLTPD